MTIWTNVALLTATTTLVGVMFVAATEQIVGPGQARAAVPAAVLCTGSAAMTLVGAIWVRRHAVGLLPAAVLAGTGLRVTVAVVGVVVLTRATAGRGLPPMRFAEWMAVFYIVTLVIETSLLIRDTVAGPRVVRAGGDDGAVPTAGQ